PRGSTTGSRRRSATTPPARCSPGSSRGTWNCTGGASPRGTGCCCWWGRPTATRGSSRTPTSTTSTATPPGSSASAAAGTSARARSVNVGGFAARPVRVEVRGPRGGPPYEDRGRPGPVPGTRHVRDGSAGPLRGPAQGKGPDPGPRTVRGRARRGPGRRPLLPHPGPQTAGDVMPSFPREELEAMVDYWLEANRRCEEAGDWRPLADLYTEDATYGWNVGPKQDFMAVGRDEIRDIALGQEMGGLDGWIYPYQSILIDERKGEVVGF